MQDRQDFTLRQDGSTQTLCTCTPIHLTCELPSHQDIYVKGSRSEIPGTPGAATWHDSSSSWKLWPGPASKRSSPKDSPGDPPTHPPHPPKLHWENCADERLRFLARRGVTLAPAINLRAKAMITSVQKPFFPVGLQRKKNDQQED